MKITLLLDVDYVMELKPSGLGGVNVEVFEIDASERHSRLTLNLDSHEAGQLISSLELLHSMAP